MKLFLCSSFLVLLVFISCNNKPKITTNSESKELPTFKALKTNETIIIDGIMNEDNWSKTESAHFDYFYNDKKKDDKQKSTFRMLWDIDNLYIFYEFEDKYLTAKELNGDGQPYNDDCAEIFLIPVPQALDTHFCFEVNIYKAANDLIFFNNYYNGESVGLKTFNPDFEVEVTYDGTLNDNSDIDKGWTMEMKIPISVFGFLGEFEPVKKGNSWRFLAIRQERNEIEGARRVISTIFPMPDDFRGVHEPFHFGVLKFIE